jgi:hypothetical protein
MPSARFLARCSRRAVSGSSVCVVPLLPLTRRTQNGRSLDASRSKSVQRRSTASLTRSPCRYHHRQQQLIALPLPTDPAGGIDDPPCLVRREIFPPHNIRLFSAISTLSWVREVEDVCGCKRRSLFNIRVSRRESRMFAPAAIS